MAKKPTVKPEVTVYERPANLIGRLFLTGGRTLRAFLNVSKDTGEQFVGFSIGQRNAETGDFEYTLLFRSELEASPKVDAFVDAINAKYPNLIKDEMVIY